MLLMISILIFRFSLSNDSVFKVTDSHSGDAGSILSPGDSGSEFSPVVANSTHGACIVDGCSSDGDPGILCTGLLQLGT